MWHPRPRAHQLGVAVGEGEADAGGAPFPAARREAGIDGVGVPAGDLVGAGGVFAHADAGLEDGEDLVDGAPKPLLEKATKEAAADAKAKLEAAKAVTSILKKKEDEEELAALKEKINTYLEYASVVQNITQALDQAKTNKENAELERDRALNDKKIRNLDSRLKAGAISQRQYDKEVQKIEKEQEKREKEIRIKQFNRQKKQQLIAAIINTAEAVTEALPNVFLAALVGAAGAIQIGLIASQKPPEFAAGGKLGGRSHDSGGNAVIDGSGRKIAEVEAGEGIVNKRTMGDNRKYNVSGTPSQIISRLNSMYGTSWEGGATLIPAWRNYQPQRMNYAAMKNVYAAGGTFQQSTAGTNGSQDAIFENLTAMISNMQATNAYLANTLANGITADVSLRRFNTQQERFDAIKKDATLK